jgi:predicted DNA-binding protein YlxM (UPF0122 family)
MSEEWRDIPDSTYEVSNQGRVRRKTNGRIRSLPIGTSGYQTIRIPIAGIPKNQYIHRLVAHAFIGPCPDGKEVNHIDGDKLNNRPNNLEYVTPVENAHHAFFTIRKGIPVVGEQSGCAKLTESQVTEIHRLYATGNYRLNKIAERFSVTPSQIGLIVKGKSWKHLGLRAIPTNDYCLGGEQHPQSKLSNRQREEIRRLHLDGLSLSELSSRYCVAKSTIHRVLKSSS